MGNYKLSFQFRSICAVIQFAVCFLGIWLIQTTPLVMPAFAAAVVSSFVTFLLLPIAYEMSDNLQYESDPKKQRANFVKLMLCLAGMVLSVLGPVAYFFV